jgi:hypothetical protein
LPDLRLTECLGVRLNLRALLTHRLSRVFVWLLTALRAVEVTILGIWIGQCRFSSFTVGYASSCGK